MGPLGAAERDGLDAGPRGRPGRTGSTRRDDHRVNLQEPSKEPGGRSRWMSPTRRVPASSCASTWSQKAGSELASRHGQDGGRAADGYPRWTSCAAPSHGERSEHRANSRNGIHPGPFSGSQTILGEPPRTPRSWTQLDNYSEDATARSLPKSELASSPGNMRHRHDGVTGHHLTSQKEPPGESWRLLPLRGWSHAEESLFAGGA